MGINFLNLITSLNYLIIYIYPKFFGKSLNSSGYNYLKFIKPEIKLSKLSGKQGDNNTGFYSLKIDFE